MSSNTKSRLDNLSQPVLFQKIGEICAAVNTVKNTNDLLEVSLKQIMDLFNANRGSIFILNETRKNLVLKIAKGMRSYEKAKIIKRMGEGIVGKVAELKQPVVVDDISKDHRFGNIKAKKEGYSTASFICAPLIIKDKLIGVINITDKESGLSFNKNEMQLLDFLSLQIALNYSRVQLFQNLKKIKKKTQTLKNKLGKSDKETEYLKKQIYIQEKLATIGKLAGGIAHEFNNPLDGVIRYTNLCLEHVRDDEVVRGYLLEIKHGLNRMANIVKNLLVCSRHDIPKKQKVSFNKAVEHSISVLQPDINHKYVTVINKVDGDIPPILDLGLERIVINLLRNALDAVEDGGEIEIKASYEDSFLTFSVRDNGVGIPQEELDRVFEPFFTTKDIDRGCGLGLTIIGEIVKGYDGKIDVESKQGKGTTFIIKIHDEK